MADLNLTFCLIDEIGSCHVNPDAFKFILTVNCEKLPGTDKLPVG